MWFKNATLYGINRKFQFKPEALASKAFLPPTDHQIESSGWTDVRPGELSMRSGDHVLLYFTQEKKHIPSSAVDLLLNEKAAELEAAQGFAPGKKSRKDLKERVIDELLPRALSTRRRTMVWLDLKSHRLVIDSTSSPVVDAIVSALIRGYEDLGIEDVSWPRSAVITEWAREAPSGFTADDEVSLAYPGDHGKTVKFKLADPSGWDVQEHIQKHGASIENLAMTFDSRLSFVMTENAQVRRIKALDVVMDGVAAEKDVDRFESDFVLMAAELDILFNALIAEA